MPPGVRQKPPFSLPSLFGLLGMLIALVVLLPTCETVRRGKLDRPIELFVLADQASDATPVPYADETGAVTGFVSREPDFVIDRLDELILEVRQLPVFEAGRIVGKQPHRFATLYLPRRDRKALAAFSEKAVHHLLLIRMSGQPLSTRFMTEPLSRDEAFVISGPDDEAMQEAMRLLQASYEGRLLPQSPMPQK